jgi:hypothetical protein
VSGFKLRVAGAVDTGIARWAKVLRKLLRKYEEDGGEAVRCA